MDREKLAKRAEIARCFPSAYRGSTSDFAEETRRALSFRKIRLTDWDILPSGKDTTDFCKLFKTLGEATEPVLFECKNHSIVVSGYGGKKRVPLVVFLCAISFTEIYGERLYIADVEDEKGAKARLILEEKNAYSKSPST